MASQEHVSSDHPWSDFRPVRKPGYRLEQLDDELLLYHPSENQIVYLNQTASMVWGLCDGNRSVREIVQLLNQAYPEAAASLSADVFGVLGKFHEASCIQLDQDTGS